MYMKKELQDEMWALMEWAVNESNLGKLSPSGKVRTKEEDEAQYVEFHPAFWAALHLQDWLEEM